MSTSTNGAVTGDPTRTLIDAVKSSLAELDAYSVSEMTDEAEFAEMIGRLRSLVGVLVSIIDH